MNGERARELLVERILRGCAARPDQPAVVSEAATLDYGALGAAVRRLAELLRATGPPGSRLALLLDRGPELVVAQLAAVAAGWIFVPVDTRYPAERIAYILEDCLPGLVIAPAGLAPEASRLDPAHVLGPAPELQPRPAADGPGDRELSAAAPVYMIYTSGTTGRPKGVLIGAEALANLVDWHERRYLHEPGRRTMLYASPGFDASVWEIWPALAAGAQIHVPDELVRTDPGLLHDWLVRTAITVAFLPTQAAQRAARQAWPAHTALRYLLTGGEALAAVDWARLPFELVNHYGPTECTVLATAIALSEWDRASSPLPPIGYPITNTQVYAAAEDLTPLGPGETGELVVSGACVGLGYWNRPELTAERFVRLPGRPGTRGYRTGDYGHCDEAGRWHFAGRRDGQVKLGGRRVELGEVERSAEGCAGVAVAAATVRDGAVVLYVVPAGRGEPGAQGLPERVRSALAERLPHYMVPARIGLVDELPVTANGKVDRAALERWPVPGEALSGVPTPGDAAPRAAEPCAAVPGGAGQAAVGPDASIVRIWCEVLGTAGADARENFFAEGDSLAAAQLAVRLRSATGRAVPADLVYRHPVLADLADAVGLLPPEPTDPARGARSGPARTGPLSFGQQQRLDSERSAQAEGVRIRPRNNLAVFEVDGPLESTALQAAGAALLARHSALRTAIRRAPDGLCQQIRPVGATPEWFRVIEFPDGDRADAVRAAEALRDCRLDLEGDSMLQLAVFRFGPRSALVVLLVEQAVSDGWSIGLLAEQLGEHYRHTLHGPDPGSEPGPAEGLEQFLDFAVRQRAQAESGVFEEQLGFWTRQLSAAGPEAESALELALPMSEVPARGVAVQRADGAPGLTHGLAAFCARLSVTRFTVLVTGVLRALAAETGQEDCSLLTIAANREEPGAQDAVGCYANLVVVAARLPASLDFAEAALRVGEAVRSAYAHQAVPHALVRRRLDPDRAGLPPCAPSVFLGLVDGRLTPRLRLGAPSAARLLRLDHTPPARGRFSIDVETRADSLSLISTCELGRFAPELPGRLLGAALAEIEAAVQRKPADRRAQM